ncbi:hypothetical protein ILUMI_10579 [Ignelater luminosus]|uniref:Uncharacterized protein n=1 Tax=Ignelater luminosus TaxID=2038154 RepID=A0A8K0GBC4_IGNLU|nr:hypothetical protein ILUMI_10579 [Ignelater luminosus]
MNHEGRTAEYETQDGIPRRLSGRHRPSIVGTVLPTYGDDTGRIVDVENLIRPFRTPVSLSTSTVVIDNLHDTFSTLQLPLHTIVPYLRRVDASKVINHKSLPDKTEVQKKEKKRVSFSENVPKHDPTSYFDVPPELMMMVPYTPDRVGNQDVIADPEEQPAIENEETPAEVRRSERPRRQPTYLSDYIQ